MEGPKTQHTLTLTDRQICDLELIMNQGFEPLNGFMGQADYDSVLDKLTLADGTIWPMPITLDISTGFAGRVVKGESIALINKEGHPLATLEITDIYAPDKKREAQNVFGTTDEAHPAVNVLFNKTGDYYLGGIVTPLKLPTHYDFAELRLTPEQLKTSFRQKGWERIVGFQTRNPMHRAHVALTEQAAKEIDGHVLIHPVVGMTKPHDIDHFTRVKCYKKIMPHYAKGQAQLSLLPLAMRMGGPREALWHAIIRKNYGCTHFIVGRDHAGPGKDSNGKPFYDPYAAQDLVKEYETKIGITMIPFQEMVYVKNKKVYLPLDQLSPEDETLKISGTELRDKLRTGAPIPEWFSYPEVAKTLRQSCPPNTEKGFTVFFTGLSGAGKSTIANALAAKLMMTDDRSVTLLDGDLIRRHLSSELTFSKEHRDLNIERIGFVAGEITKAGGIAICAAISPYEKARHAAREQVEQYGPFIEVHMSTPLETCETRDPKGLYAKARAGIIKKFTGVNDPYENPSHPDLVLDTSVLSVEHTVTAIAVHLIGKGCLEREAHTIPQREEALA